jgi:hypothetical protein
VTQENPIVRMLVPADAAPVPYSDVVGVTLPVIESEDVAAVVRSVRDEMHRRIQDLEEKRKGVTAHLVAATNAVNALFRPVREPLEALKALCKERLDAWETSKIAAERAAQAAARALAAQGQVNAAAVVLEAGQAQASTAPRAWEVDMPNVDFDQVPREYLTVDWSKVKIHCRTYAKSEEIPAVPGIPFKRVGVTRAGG